MGEAEGSICKDISLVCEIKVNQRKTNQRAVADYSAAALLMTDMESILLFEHGVFFQHFLVVFDVLCDLATEEQHTDQVRDCHQGVGDVGEIPDEIQCGNGADEHNERKENPVYHIKSMRSKYILIGFLAVVFPPENRGEGKQGNADTYKPAARRTEYSAKAAIVREEPSYNSPVAGFA